MTRFLDGPAEGKTLMLRRGPLFLRVTLDGVGGFDALDQPEDQPLSGEKIYAYRMEGTPGVCHIRARRGGGLYSIADYRLIPEQPTDAVMRDNAAWVQWVLNVHAAEKETRTA